MKVVKLVKAVTRGLFATLLAACGASGGERAGAESAPPAPAESKHPATGPLSEEAFKALHQLDPAPRPPPKGEAVEVGGAHAYLSLPPGASAPLPGVLVIHEWWGLNDNIKHWSDRLAAAGYAALALDLYGGVVATDPDTAMRTMKAVDEAKAKAIVEAGHQFLVSDARVRAPRTGSIGWCFGGGWSLRAALALPELDASVVYYGFVPTEADKLRPIKAKVLAIFGTRDESIPAAKVDAFAAGLKQAGVSARVLRYDADHAFANPSSKAYDQGDAAAAWQEVQAFFAANLKGG
jgi:carboxymethylenebutenolidase